MSSARQCRLIAMRCTARRHRRLPTVSGSDLTASCSAEQSSPVLLASVYFVLVCSIILHSALRVMGSRGHWSSFQLCEGGAKSCTMGTLILFLILFIALFVLVKWYLFVKFVFVTIVLVFRANVFIQ